MVWVGGSDCDGFSALEVWLSSLGGRCIIWLGFFDIGLGSGFYRAFFVRWTWGGSYHRGIVCLTVGMNMDQGAVGGRIWGLCFSGLRISGCLCQRS